MTKGKIRLIIFAMTMASLTLLAFQGFWINYAFQSKKATFDLQVKEAMNTVVRKLEKQELAVFTQKYAENKIKNQELLALKSLEQKEFQKQAKLNKPSTKNYANKSKNEDIATVGLPEPAEESMFKAALAPFSQMFEPNNDANEGLTIDKIKKIVVLPKNKGKGKDYRKVKDFNNIKVEPKQPEIASDYLQNQNEMVDDVNVTFTISGEGLEDMKEAEKQYKLFLKELGIVTDSSALPIQKEAKLKAFNAKKTNKKRVYTANKESKNKAQNSQYNTKISNKKAVLKDVLEDFMLKNRTVHERVDAKILDSLLRNELKEKGLEYPIEYAIGNKYTNGPMQFLSSTSMDKNTKKKLFTTKYAAVLFPNDVYQNGQQLLLYFYNSDYHIFKGIWLNILGSLFMIGIVFYCFYIAVTNIIKQKKMAEIKNDFINNMTHEFKTPISTISLACEVLAEGNKNTNTPAMNRYLGIIRDENKRLGSQVEKVLQTALLDRGDLKMKMADINLHDVLESAIHNIKPQFELKNGFVSLEANATFDTVKADMVHISNIVFNLMDNAMKYNNTTPELKIVTENILGGIQIKFIDNGLGISEEAQKLIFDKFYRVPTGNLHDVKGFGLGLSYVKKMIEEHSGYIKVKSKIGQGSTFELFLPQKNT